MDSSSSYVSRPSKAFDASSTRRRHWMLSSSLWLAVAALALSIYHPVVYEFFTRKRFQPTWAAKIPHRDRTFPATYIKGAKHDADYQRLQRTPRESSKHQVDTTAVLLNWSRLANVVNITALLCSTELADIMAKVKIWNNSPQILTPQDFAMANCPQERLEIYNSPENLYFQARFLACADAQTPYCFIQDDDYLVLPEAIQALRFRFRDLEAQFPSDPPSIHLLPPHDYLKSLLRTVYSPTRGIHSSFAWLGYGSFLRQKQASRFLDTMERIGASKEEMKMADNYFTILRNKAPELWFDHNIELGGGQAFTVGSEGDERNQRHINKALNYLQGLFPVNGDLHSRSHESNSSAAIAAPQRYISRTPCLGSPCVLETNIDIHSFHAMEAHQKQDEFSFNISVLDGIGMEQLDRFLRYPPSNAVNGNVTGRFMSREPVHPGDYVSLLFYDTDVSSWTKLELVALVDYETSRVLQSAVLEMLNYKRYEPLKGIQVACADIPDVGDENPDRWECSFAIGSSSFAIGSTASAQGFRVRSMTQGKEEWCIYDIWVRGAHLG